MISTIIEITAGFMTGSAVWFLSRLEPWRRWGFVIGLAAQPLFLYVILTTETYGLLLLAGICTYGRIMGIYNYFIRK